MRHKRHTVKLCTSGPGWTLPHYSGQTTPPRATRATRKPSPETPPRRPPNAPRERSLRPQRNSRTPGFPWSPGYHTRFDRDLCGSAGQGCGRCRTPASRGFTSFPFSTGAAKSGAENFRSDRQLGRCRRPASRGAGHRGAPETRSPKRARGCPALARVKARHRRDATGNPPRRPGHPARGAEVRHETGYPNLIADLCGFPGWLPGQQSTFQTGIATE